jgi:hypothetical protein
LLAIRLSVDTTGFVDNHLDDLIEKCKKVHSALRIRITEILKQLTNLSYLDLPTACIAQAVGDLRKISSYVSEAFSKKDGLTITGPLHPLKYPLLHCTC